MLVRASSGSGGGGSINPDIQYGSTNIGDSAQNKTFSVTSGKTYVFTTGIRGASFTPVLSVTNANVLSHPNKIWTCYRQDGYYDYFETVIFKATNSSITISSTDLDSPMTGMTLIQLD